MRFLNVMILVLAALLVVCAGCRKSNTTASEPKQEMVQIKGSDTMINLGQAWAEHYRSVDPSAQIIVQGGGSGTGITAFLEGNADIAQSSRSMKDEEIEKAKAKGITPVEHIVGWDGIAVVVNPKNTVKSLTIDQLAAIYTGKISNWKEVGGTPGPIVILTREVSSGTYVFFKEQVLQHGDSKSTVEYASSALMLSSSQAIYEEIGNNKNAIGYLGLGYVKEKVRPLPIAKDADSPAVLASVESVQNKSYPISRPMFYYTNGEPQGAVRKYLDYVLGEDGQRVVEEMDFVPSL